MVHDGTPQNSGALFMKISFYWEHVHQKIKWAFQLSFMKRCRAPVTWTIRIDFWKLNYSTIIEERARYCKGLQLGFSGYLYRVRYPYIIGKISTDVPGFLLLRGRGSHFIMLNCSSHRKKRKKSCNFKTSSLWNADWLYDLGESFQIDGRAECLHSACRASRYKKLQGEVSAPPSLLSSCSYFLKK